MTRKSSAPELLKLKWFLKQAIQHPLATWLVRLCDMGKVG